MNNHQSGLGRADSLDDQERSIQPVYPTCPSLPYVNDPGFLHDGHGVPVERVSSLPANFVGHLGMDPYAAPQNVHQDHASSAGAASVEDMAAVMKLLQETLPKLNSNVQAPLTYVPPTISPPRQLLTTSDTVTAPISPIPAVSPYFIVGRQMPPYPVVAVGSVPKECAYGYGVCPGSPTQPISASPTPCHTPAGPSSIVWQHGSCILHPAVDERSPLLKSVVRSEIMGSGNMALSGSTILQDVASPRRKCRFSKKQILTLASMLLVDLSSFASMSILAPFFPEQIKRFNLGPSLDGIVFGVYAFIIVVVSPIIGKLLPVLNSRKVYLSGILAAAVSNICFGMVQYIKTPVLFVVVAIFLRIVTAVGTAAFLTVIYSLVPILYPEDINMVNGMMETAVGVGMCVGPGVGVWLYAIGGFGLPFYGLGGFIVLCAFINYITFPYDEVALVPLNESGGVMKVLCKAGAILPLVILCVTATSLAILYPTLQPHMSKLGVSIEGVGLVFLLMSAVYAVSSPLVGLATDRFHCPWGFMSSGLLIMAVALVLLGNSPLFPHLPHKELYNQDVIAIVFLGLSSAMCIVPTYAAILESATREGQVVDMAIYAVVGGLWSSSYSLGEMLGPLLAGTMAEYITFAMSTTVIAILPAALAIVCGAFMCVERHRSRKMSTC